jgi:hypothetical protein
MCTSHAAAAEDWFASRLVKLRSWWFARPRIASETLAVIREHLDDLFHSETDYERFPERRFVP